jgi:serine/threonine protein kinase
MVNMSATPKPTIFAKPELFRQAHEYHTDHPEAGLKFKFGISPNRFTFFYSSAGDAYAIKGKKSTTSGQPQHIGRGGIKKVKLGQDNKKNIYAVDVIKNEGMHFARHPQNQNSIIISADLMESIEALKKINYLKYFLIDVNSNKIYIFRTFIDGSNLAEKRILNSDRSTALAEYALKMAWEIRNLHDKNILHGDVKINNFVINNNQKINIIDFDSARIIATNDGKYIPKNIWFTTPDAAPEIKNQQFYSKKSDVYAFGKTISNMSISSKWNDLINSMTQYNDLARPSMKAVINKIIALKDDAKKTNHWTIPFYAFTTSVGIISALPASLATMVMLTTVVAAVCLAIVGVARLRNKWIQRCYNKLANDNVDNNDELNHEKLNQLSQETVDKIKYGYSLGSQNHYQALAWLYPSTYSKEYYAGLRLQECNPQLDWKSIKPKAKP